MLENIWKTITGVALIVGIIGTLYYSAAYLLGSIIMGLLTYGVATKYRGRKGIWPFIYGFTWGLVALVYYIVAKKEK